GANPVYAESVADEHSSMGHLRTLFSAAFLFISSLVFSQTAQLHTSNTIVFLNAGLQAPQLLAIQVPGQRQWENRASEALISSVEIAGVHIPVHWQLDREASRNDEKTASFVYQSSDPPLRLTWSWFAQADFGPVEHETRIENLSPREIWIPLQDSF